MSRLVNGLLHFQKRMSDEESLRFKLVQLEGNQNITIEKTASGRKVELQENSEEVEAEALRVRRDRDEMLRQRDEAKRELREVEKKLDEVKERQRCNLLKSSQGERQRSSSRREEYERGERASESRRSKFVSDRVQSKSRSRRRSRERSRSPFSNSGRRIRLSCQSRVFIETTRQAT